jgi:hypothetical protein
LLPALEAGPVTDDDGAERTVTRPTESTAAADRTAESFLELEGELDDGADPTSGRATGLVVDAATVPAARVPDGYPLRTGVEEALALTLAIDDGRETTAYLAWPTDGTVDPDSNLGRLLAATGVEPDAFADLYGTRLLVERVGEHDTVYVPAVRPQGTGDWALGVAGGLGFNLAFFGLVGLATAGLPLSGVLTPVTVLFLLVNLVLLPYATYRDATYLRSHSDWEQGPPFWAALSMVPGLNVAASALYLRSRARSWFIGEEPSLLTRLRRRVREAA